MHHLFVCKFVLVVTYFSGFEKVKEERFSRTTKCALIKHVVKQNVKCLHIKRKKTRAFNKSKCTFAAD